MKIVLKLTTIATVIILFAISCQKTSMLDETGNLNTNKEFNAAAAKLWYYKYFENSNEGKQSNGKKVPLWKNEIYHKAGKFEIIEFPLIMDKKQISLPSDLSQYDKKRIAEASLSKIKFTKNEMGQIFVTEVTYIPDIEYLKMKNFDISTTSYGKANEDFTGRMIIKKWSGKELSINIVTNGIITSKKRIIRNNEAAIARVNTEPENNSYELPDCGTGTLLCTFEQWCDVYPDGFVTNCGDWYMVEGSCYCEGGDDGGDEDECELYGTGCDNNPVDPDEPNVCAPVDENPAYLSFLASIGNITNSSSMTSGPSIVINTNNDNKPVSWDVVSGAWGRVSSIEQMTRERQVVGNNLIWIITDFQHGEHALSKSSYITSSPHNVELPLISFTPNVINPLTASMQAVGRLEFFFCGIHLSSRDYSINETQIIHAYD